jgi:hypothetical protein
MIEPNEAEKEAVRNGQLIEAIKLVRTRTGTGLKEAKDAAEEYRAQLRQLRQPARHEQDASTGGWRWIAIVLVILLGLLWLASRLGMISL